MNKIHQIKLNKVQEEKKLITNYSDNNHLVLVGRITSDKRFSHEIYGEKFYVYFKNGGKF